jgi:hypothetical protein
MFPPSSPPLNESYGQAYGTASRAAICGKGILKIGTKNQVLQYKGREYASVLQGAFCDHCDDGFPEHDPQEEEAWIKFRDSCG